MTDAQEIARGRRARQEWAELEGAFARLRQAMMEEIIATPFAEAERRERLYLSCQVLDAVKAALLAAVGAGEAAKLRAEGG
ncbi:MAG TPA: hypothetical protein VG939_05805 [Caulobacteraceae bacterium]|nr:hypothetical protein [Caulobacteraceae bacterium]